MDIANISTTENLKDLTDYYGYRCRKYAKLLTANEDSENKSMNCFSLTNQSKINTTIIIIISTQFKNS